MVDTQVRLIDLMPTVLDVVGIEPTGPVDGRSLLPLLDRRPSADFPPEAWAYAASSNHGLAMRLDNRLKYRFPDPAWAEVAHREALYDLESDPDERSQSRTRRSPTRRAPRHDPGDDPRPAPGHPARDPQRRRRHPRGPAGRRVGGPRPRQDRLSPRRSGPLGRRQPGRPSGSNRATGRRCSSPSSPPPEVGIEVWAEGVDGGHEIALTPPSISPYSRPRPLFILTEDGWRLDEDFAGAVDTGFLITRIGDAHPSSATDSPPTPRSSSSSRRWDTFNNYEF